MNELLDAAKAVIDATDTGDRWCAIAHLRAAVERAEQQEVVGFEAWYQRVMDDDKTTVKVKDCWLAAQQAERERIKAIIQDMPEATSPSFAWVCDKIMENMNDT